MARRWIISDTHFNHANILNFLNDDGSHLREFADVKEMNEMMIENWNNCVKGEDTILHLGDFSMGNATRFREIISRLNGRKILIKGNHDNLKLSNYAEFFDDIRSFDRPNSQKIVFTHIPLHPSSLKEGVINAHGHTHWRDVRHESGELDYKYLNLSIEKTNFSPVSMDWVIEQANKQRDLCGKE